MKQAIIAVLALLLPLSPLAAQDKSSADDVFERGCGDDQGTDRCDPEIQAKMRSIYGWDSIESLAEKGTEIYRAMLIDGYGNDVVAISFVRENGLSPYVDVRAPSLNPADEQLLRAVISDEVWQRVQSRSANFDKRLASEVSEDGGSNRICLHAWVAVVEATRRTAPFLSSTVNIGEEGLSVKTQEIERPAVTARQDVENACADGLAIPFAFALADEARHALAECTNLDLNDFRNASTMLALCHRLRGDRLTAGRAYPVVKELELYWRRSKDKDISSLFVSLDETEQTKFEESVKGAFVVYGAPRATTQNDATINAELFYFVGEDAERPIEQATLTIQLYDYADKFRILSWEVSPKRPVAMPAD